MHGLTFREVDVKASKVEHWLKHSLSLLLPAYLTVSCGSERWKEQCEQHWLSAASDTGYMALSNMLNTILRRMPITWLGAGCSTLGLCSCSYLPGILPAALAQVGVGMCLPKLSDSLCGFPGSCRLHCIDAPPRCVW